MVKENQEIFSMSHESIVTHLRDAGYVSRMYVYAVRTERQKHAVALGCMRLAARKV